MYTSRSTSLSSLPHSPFPALSFLPSIHPPFPGSKFSPRYACLLVLCSWCYALIFAVGPATGWGEYGPEPYGTACCIDWGRSSHEPLARSYTVALFLCCYVLPCALISSSYTLILLTMRHSRRALRRHSHKRVHLHTQTRMGNIQIVIVKVRQEVRDVSIGSIYSI